MCGVIGVVFERHRDDLGRVSAGLLKQLEYRGYDSTGAAVQGDGAEIVLRKGVGAPSVVVEDLGIVDLAGRTMVGQVRWATFGAVDDRNAQPHEMRCRTHLYGAHNGNVTNCDSLKSWLQSEGHTVRSDNDGEMLVHAVEHDFARELARLDDPGDHASRRAAMRTAICSAASRLRGSYAAVVADPVSRALFAIKNGSSLYFGIGADDVGGRFGIASSDLSAVLRLTRQLVSMSEGEFVEFDPCGYQVYRIGDVATPVDKPAVRSRLRAKDTALRPPFETFMDQEISAQEETCRDVVTAFGGGSGGLRTLSPTLEKMADDALAELHAGIEGLRGESHADRVESRFRELLRTPALDGLLSSLDSRDAQRLRDGADQLASSEAGLFADLLPRAASDREAVALRVLDAIVEHEEVTESSIAYERFCDLCVDALSKRARVFILCCGSSFHAARAAALFFDEIARTAVVPTRPGDFRGQHVNSLADGDVIVAVSQSGETKDLIDVLNAVARSGRDVRCIGLVNNVNSTLAQEKCDVVIPLRCGPEIAVPATKSFMNQMVVFYCLALRLAERRADDDAWRRDVARRRQKLPQLPDLIRAAVETTDADVERAAGELYLAPSMHILATRITAVAEEGALKVREVVLNHTEGFEASEFKHGPNTILGFNTLFGPGQVEALLKRLGELQERAIRAAEPSPDRAGALARAIAESVFAPKGAALSLSDEERRACDEHVDRDSFLGALYADYPLIFVTGPDERDVHLTVSQVNTHKIRGASTVMIAEDHTDLRQAAQKAPANNPDYRAVYIPLPRTGDTLLTMFSSTVVLQRLALKMSLLKMAYLDRLGIREHGVHPDVPKNVSKSITVD